MLQLISENGFFDENREWVQLEGMQLVVTADGGAGDGGRAVSERLSSIMRITYLS